MSITLTIIHVSDEQHQEQARQFVKSYHAHPPGVDHETVLVMQAGRLSAEMTQLFASLPKVNVYHHDDTGHDIGGYLAASKHIQTDLMACFGGSTFVRKGGWMRRMVEAVDKHGNGMYGPTASYQITPHLNTTGFWLPTKLLAAYDKPVVTRHDRYEFEHGCSAFWKIVQFNMKLPVKMVTHDGEYDWDQWRDPSLKGIYHRDDQSACLSVFRHGLNYQLASPRFKRIYESLANTLTDRSMKKP
jgi:hypothetical protein